MAPKESSKKAKSSKKVESSKKVKSASSKKSKTPPVPSKSNASTEFVADSDKDSEDSDSDDSPATVKSSSKAPVKAKDSKKSKEKSKKVVPPVVQEESSTSDEEGSEENEEQNEDEDEDESDSDEDEPAQAQNSRPSQPQSQQSTSTPEPSKPAAEYQLPKGFEPLPSPSSSARPPKVASLLSKTNLANKKVFHFTTPASVPIKALKHLKYDDIEAGKISFSSAGNEYEVGEEKDGGEGEEMMIMVAKDGKDYNVGKHLKVAKSLHFRQTVPSALTTGTSRATIPQKRPAREQPAGLRIRFRSGEIGSALSSEADSDSD